MAPILPTTCGFADEIPGIKIVNPPSSSLTTTNALILLHGLGDSSASFAKLATQLSLKDTVCICVQGLTPMPFDLGGFHWGDDIVFDQASGHVDPDAGFSKATRLIKSEVIEKHLLEKYFFTPRDILIFGLGQGAMVALSVAASLDGTELGGIVSLGGALPGSTSVSTKSQTPILVVAGSSRTAVTRPTLDRLKSSFANVEYHKWPRPGDGMPTNREEMLPIMRFFARRLRSMQGVPEGSIPLT